MLCACMVCMRVKMCSGLCSNRAGSGAAGGLMVFENRYEDAVELFDGVGGAIEGVHQGFASAADVGLGIA